MRLTITTFLALFKVRRSERRREVPMLQRGRAVLLLAAWCATPAHALVSVTVDRTDDVIDGDCSRSA